MPKKTDRRPINSPTLLGIKPSAQMNFPRFAARPHKSRVLR